MRQFAVALVAAIAAVAGFAQPVAPVDHVAAASSGPKIVIIVGATHGTTETYRGYADQEYNRIVSQGYTAPENIKKIYSPNATWAAVKAAVAGASIVIYHGHGNGWPSPYKYDAAYKTKDGFGLNEVAGQGDYNNVYYGEPSIETLDPAPNAIMLLHNLCYASGNPASGTEPNASVARQRADNYASAFLRAGFGAVVAGGKESAIPYLDALFTTDQTLDDMWTYSPGAKGNKFDFASVRTPGATVAMDPEAPGKYYRAYTTEDLTLRTTDVIAGATPPEPIDVGPSAYNPIEPTRVLDSRVGLGVGGPFYQGKAKGCLVAGIGDVPADAVAVTGNLTVVGQTSAGYVALGPVKVDVPSTSTLNFPKADIRANGVTVPLSTAGTLAATFKGASGSRTHLVFDVTGYYLENPSAGAAYVPIAPERHLDTRDGTGLSGAFVAGSARSWTVAGVGAVPANATAVSGNLTVTNQSAAGYVSLGPVATNSPTTSTLNFPRFDTRANGVTVPLGAGGSLSATYMASAGATTQLVFDVTGYFVAAGAGSIYIPINPERHLDSRDGTGLAGAFTNGSARSWTIAGLGSVPANATAITGNLTVVGQTRAGFVSLGPVATNSPTTSTLNFPLGDVRANGVTVPLGAGGILSATYMASGSATTHLVFDVTGYFLAP